MQARRTMYLFRVFWFPNTESCLNTKLFPPLGVRTSLAISIDMKVNPELAGELTVAIDALTCSCRDCDGHGTCLLNVGGPASLIAGYLT